MSKSKGFVYVATGTAYLEEARRSAESLRRHHPEVPICLISDRPPAEKGPFTEIRRPAGVVRREAARAWLEEKRFLKYKVRFLPAKQGEGSRSSP